MSKPCLTILILAIAFSGCSRGPALVDVEGAVTLQGEPISDIKVELWPESPGPRSIGISDAQGKFRLTTDDRKYRGAVSGRHKVVLRDQRVLGDKLLGRAGEDVDMTEGRKSRISLEYLDPLKSALVVEVTPDRPTIEIEAGPGRMQ